MAGATQPIVEWWPERGTAIEAKKGRDILIGLQAGFGAGRVWTLRAPGGVEILRELISATSDTGNQAVYRSLIKALGKHGGVRVQVSY